MLIRKVDRFSQVSGGKGYAKRAEYPERYTNPYNLGSCWNRFYPARDCRSVQAP
jgi:hypothetical protein